MKCTYNLGIQENKNIKNEVTQSANALRNEVNSYWRQLEEEGKEEVKHDYQLACDNYVKMDDLIKNIEMCLQVFIEKYNHCENNPCTCKRINDEGLTLIRSIYCKTYHLEDELYSNFKGSSYSFLSEAKRIMEEVEADNIKEWLRHILSGDKQINTDKTFKFDECVICLTNPPNVLFCNCGHKCICINCNKKKSLVKCPVCKTENTIKRILN